MFTVCASSFEFSSEVQTAQANYKGPSGVVQVSDASITRERYVIRLVIEDTDYNYLQLALGELSLLFNDNVDQELITVCPLTSTTYFDTRIVAATSTRTFAYNRSDRQIMKRVDASPTTINQYFVDPTINTIEFHPGDVGKIIDILITESPFSTGCLGAFPNTGELFRFGFTGKFFGIHDGGVYRLEIPEMRRISGPTLNFGSNPATVTLEYVAVCGETEQSSRKPFRLYNSEIFVTTNDACYLLEESGDILLEDESGCILLEVN